jgi:hypothetical protein
VGCGPGCDAGHALAGGWANRLSVEEQRGLTALFWSDINPYGTFRLEMEKRLDLALTAELLPVPAPRAHPAPTVAEAQ